MLNLGRVFVLVVQLGRVVGRLLLRGRSCFEVQTRVAGLAFVCRGCDC